jgi:prolyl oligopeptidase
MRSRFCLHRTLTIFVAATLLWTRQAMPASPPIAPVESVIDHYFGTEVVDPYRYMEQSESPRVQEWMKAQARTIPSSILLRAGSTW